MLVESQISAKEYKYLILNLFYKKTSFLIFCFIGLLLLVMYLFNVNIEGLEKTPVYYLYFSSFFLVINPLLVYYTIYKQINSNIEFTEKIKYNFTNENINIDGETFSQIIYWREIKQIKKTQNWIFIFLKDKTIYIISIKNNTAQYSELENIISGQGF
ncbi:YcxB family protein [Apibacter raozihei]|uniref:YcxB family protein n=2 Tax=Apibacter TaxID=1778601 RepID=UPI000FE2E2A9|nr:YcxB family protein [Apibacter sp. HY039]